MLKVQAAAEAEATRAFSDDQAFSGCWSLLCEATKREDFSFAFCCSELLLPFFVSISFKLYIYIYICIYFLNIHFNFLLLVLLVLLHLFKV